MRYLAVVILAVAPACATRAMAPVTPVTPARDLAAATAAASGGTDGAAAAAKDPRIVDLDIIRITARTPAPGREPELTSVASADLFKEATAAAAAGRQRDAIAAYRQLAAEFPESQYAPLALFNLAAIHDAQRDLTATLTVLGELVASYPTSRESIDGHLYIAALQADHRQWTDAAATLAAVLQRSSLTFADRIEALARKGYGELEQGRYDAADASLQAAIAEWRRAPRIDDPYYIAMAHYYRGEIVHRKFAETALRAGDDAMIADLETKRRLAAEAYDRWHASLAFKHPYWATAAGYQMSQIFVELWDAHVKAPYPRGMSASTRPSYVAEVHARLRDDLEKALEGHRMNVELARAYGVSTPWSEGSEQQASAIMELLARDRAGSYITPSQ